jgi:hypothetical protein
LAPNLFAVTKSARRDSGSKSHEHVYLLGSRSADEEGVKVEASAPGGPTAPVGRAGGTVTVA